MIVGRQIYSYPFLLSHLSSVFSPLYVNILIKMKKFLLELMNRLPHFSTQSIGWYVKLTKDLFMD